MSNTYYKNDYQNRYVGSEIEDNSFIKEFFSKNSVDTISRQCTLQLKGVDEQGRDIIIPDRRILEVMNTVRESYNFATGFDAPYISPEQYVQNMINQCIERIVFDVSNTLQIEQCNMKKTIWTTVLGDFNAQKLQSHSKIKIRHKHPTFSINMRY